MESGASVLRILLGKEEDEEEELFCPTEEELAEELAMMPDFAPNVGCIFVISFLPSNLI